MSSYNEALKLKLAWQTAFEQRTCPPAEILYTESPDENLKKHLSFCDSCRESRAIAKDGKAGFQGLFAELASNTVAHKSDALKQAGQIWTIDTSLGRWVENGRYFSSPTVLLLSRSTAGSARKVAQLYTDKRLMGDGDVWLGDQFGFAQSWNCYSIPRNALECWLGTVSESLVSEVATRAAMNMQPPTVDSIISFFREMETAVGLSAVQAMEAVKAAESSQNEAFLHNVFGTLAEAYQKLSGFKLSDYADSLLDLLSTARDPHAITPVIAATSIPLQVNIVIKQHDGAITIKTVGATLTESNWDDGDYYVAGKLQEAQQEDLFLVASLNLDGNIVCECQSSIEAGSPFFDIVFQSVAKEASAIENLKFILVRP